MKKQFLITLFFCLCVGVVAAPLKPASGQQKPDAQKPAERDKDDVVKIGVTLVQIDAVVTDRKGHYVTDLKPEDFEISEDGKRQHITNFSYVSTQPSAPAPATSKEKPLKGEPSLPPVPSRLKPEQVRRTMALVVDDLGLSFESTASVRDALKKFVDEQMQPGDLVAIIRTGAGVGALQQFTSDKRMLRAAIERIRWNPSGRGGISAFAPITRDAMSEMRDSAGRGRQGGGQLGDRNQESAGETLDRFREDLFAVGTLGALNYVVRGLRDLPGRKSVILFSDGFNIFLRARNEMNTRVFDAVRRLTDLANRASVVLYTLDARGLQVIGLTAADDVSATNAQAVTDSLEDRRTQYFDSQGGLQYLADQTGGFFIHDTNDLNRGIRRVLDDQQGYYLLGYVPEAASFRTARGVTPFHKISVKVKPVGLRVRSRTGFYGFSDDAMRPAQRTPAQQLWTALTSPFASGDIRLKLTSLFGYDQKAGAFMRSMLHIDPNQITFTKDADGQQKAVVDIVAFTFGDSGQVIDRESREFTLRVPEEVYQKILRQGLLYNINVMIKKPGAYQLRVAVRDAGSERIGSANQFIEVPDIGKKRLALSGLVLEGKELAKKSKPTDASVINVAEGAADEGDTQSGPSQRILRPGMEFSYGFAIYNATIDKTTGQPQLEAQVRLLRDGQVIFTGKQMPVGLIPQTDWRQVLAGGTLKLGADASPGEYVLQVTITDRLAKEKYSVATQWLDFEIVR